MKKFTKLLKEKRWRWTAGGVACLVIAALLFAFGSEVGVEAINLGGADVSLNTDSGNVYLIETADQLLKLGNASSEETINKSFRLNNDITVASIRQPATGTFSGTFDGNGHVITYEVIDITGSNDNTKVANGLLFGVVNGQVSNLILDIKDSSASYTRELKGEIIQDGEVVEKVEGTPASPLTNSDMIHQLSDSIEENGVIYKYHTVEEDRVKTTAYKDNALAESCFGLVCGDNQGTIEKVFVSGDGVLAVDRTGDVVSGYKTVKEYGKRGITYYYKQTKNENTETAQTAQLSLNVNLYGRKSYSSKNENLLVTVFAPKAVLNESNIEYDVTIENIGDVAIEHVDVSLNDGNSGLMAFDTIAVGTSVTTKLYKTINSSPVTVSVNVNGKIKTTEESEATSAISCNVIDVQTDVYTSANSDAVTKTFDNGLKATLKVDAAKKFQNSADFNYELILENTNTSAASSLKDIVVNSPLSDWALSSSVASDVAAKWNSENAIAAGNQIVLTKTVNVTAASDTAIGSHTEEVNLEAALKTNTYSYTNIADKTVIGDFVAAQEDPVNGEALQSGGCLYAGAVAGISSGTISEVKQTLNLSASTTEKLILGGVAGKATSGSWSDLYMLGKIDGASVFVGNGTITPTNSATTIQTSAPAGKWSEYKIPSQDDDGTISTVSGADLEWLIVDDEFEYNEPDDAGKIAIEINNKKTSNVLTYAFSYSGRKSLEERSEDTQYLSNTGEIDLGKSGYYTLLGAYATDGYYHYKTTISDNPQRVFPYIEGEWSLSIEQAKAVRTTNPVKEQMELTLSPEVSGTIHYHINDDVTIPYKGAESQIEDATLDAGVVLLPFEIENVKYHMVPEIDGHIYPAFLSDEYNEKMKTPLEKPAVTAYNFYNSEGLKQEYAEIAEGESYVAGRDMVVTPQDDVAENYTIRYMYSTIAPTEGEWEESRYLNNSDSFDSLFETEAQEYTDSAIVPTTLLGDEERIENVYLYVEISKKNYSSQIYYYGPFDVMKEEKLSAEVPSGDGYTVLQGDTVKIEGVTSQNAYIQYFVSKEATSNYKDAYWWNYNSGITMSQNSGGHIYARIAYGTKVGCEIQAVKFSEVYHFQCTFGGVCDAPKITPYTGTAGADITEDETAASEISSSTSVMLSSRTENANIFYVVSDNKKTITFTRQTAIPKEDLSDGEIVEGTKYFNIGNRWYGTQNTEVERYGESIHMINETNKPKLKYVTAIALAAGYEQSESVSFVYKIKQAQPVANPEAAVETRYTQGGDTIETATVTMGANISFYSVTPGAELYYVTGSSTATPTERMTKDGVTVTGEYNGSFVVRVQAKKEGMLDSEIVTFFYHIAEQNKVNIPTATPGTTADVPTTVLPGNKILLSTTTKEALIYYTIDGSSPVVIKNEDETYTEGNASTKLYDSTLGIVMPLDGSDYFSITAVAVKSGLAQSEEAHFTYSYPDAVLPPYANLDSGKVELNANVLLKNLTEGASIYYNVAYGENVPDDPNLSSSVFSEEYPFTITQKTTIKAMAAKDGVKSTIVTFTFDPMEQLLPPTASITSGSVVARGTVLELKAAKGAMIYYTMDGSDPTDGTNTAVMAGNSLVLNGEAGGQITIKAYAVAENKSNSEVVTFTYLFSQNSGGVTASIETGSTVSNGTKVNLISDVTEGDIYYTTDGSSPVSNGKKGTTVEITGTSGTTFTLKAVVIVNGEPGTIATFIYKIQERPDAPTASPAGGALTVATRVSLNAEADKIYYTTDGSEPTKSSLLYSDPILINRATILKAISVSEEGEISAVASFVYTAATKAATVSSSESDGAVLEPGTKIQLKTATEGAVIYYSTDGTEPTLDNLDSMLIYDGESIEISRGVTIRAVAYREDLRLSDVNAWNYHVDIIPAVEQKKAEAEKLAEEGLRDTDASELVRDNGSKNRDITTKTVKEKEYQTALIYSSNALDGKIVLETVKEEKNPYTVKKAKGIYGDDTTVLESYKVRVKSGSASVQPKDEVEVAFKIPKGYEDAALSVAFVKEDYNLKTLETRREADVLYVKTQMLGSYAIIGPERDDLLENQFPYLLLLEIAAGIALLGGISFYVVEKYKKHKKNK